MSARRRSLGSRSSSRFFCAICDTTRENDEGTTAVGWLRVSVADEVEGWTHLGICCSSKCFLELARRVHEHMDRNAEVGT